MTNTFKVRGMTVILEEFRDKRNILKDGEFNGK